MSCIVLFEYKRFYQFIIIYFAKQGTSLNFKVQGSNARIKVD